ncbi:hypothetical protein HETIRDRAFT_318462 [Heterobasidion irregulare TC 32-1]|uniref:Uncharacterized protein n=1 Tax=Heterobasidion irregulare (strain TC 32-1) TaxID=747525 RepID=W4K7M5_HETIT|nr:uncharacterized protein HETIRDRAFT_318462 [Heterobasidion irregulare TC 32-1]ETW81345.1 hypothetical protein HETIRDRAFT_318462 [Heterobasidion irregulare TC 32-1]
MLKVRSASRPWSVIRVDERALHRILPPEAAPACPEHRTVHSRGPRRHISSAVDIGTTLSGVGILAAGGAATTLHRPARVAPEPPPIAPRNKGPHDPRPNQDRPRVSRHTLARLRLPQDTLALAPEPMPQNPRAQPRRLPDERERGDRPRRIARTAGGRRARAAAHRRAPARRRACARRRRRIPAGVSGSDDKSGEGGRELACDRGVVATWEFRVDCQYYWVLAGCGLGVPGHACLLKCWSIRDNGLSRVRKTVEDSSAEAEPEREMTDRNGFASVELSRFRFGCRFITAETTQRTRNDRAGPQRRTGSPSYLGKLDATDISPRRVDNLAPKPCVQRPELLSCQYAREISIRGSGSRFGPTCVGTMLRYFCILGVEGCDLPG